MKTRTVGVAFVVVLLFGTVPANGATISFWHGGFHQDTLNWLETEVFPAFEESHGVTVEHRTIGWGPQRTEQLAVAMAAGVGPDVLMLGANYHVTENEMLIPLEKWNFGGSPFKMMAVWSTRFVDSWSERDQIIDPLWETKRYKGHIWGVPHHGEIRGIAYHSTLFAEVGLADRPPESWEKWLEYVRKLTRVEDTRIVQQGMEWPWSEVEFRWLALQNGGGVVDAENMTSRLREPEALEALQFFKELRDTARPPGYAAHSWKGFATGDVAMAWGIPFSLQLAYDEGQEVGEQVRVYAPRRSPNHDPVTLSFINALAITKQAEDPQLSWEFIEYLMSYQVTEELLNQGFEYMVLRTDVIQSGSEHIRPYLPLYEIMHQSITGLPGPFTSQLRAELRKQLNLIFADEIPVAQGLEEMDRILRRALEEDFPDDV